MPIQQMLLGAGGSAVATKTYVDDVFSTFLYDGNDSTQSLNNGIDLSSEGGLVWIKERDGTYSHNFYDTERGVGRSIYSNLDIAEEGPVSNTLTSFNTNGFSLGNHQSINDDSNTYSSWTFRKAPGLLDIQTWDGNSTAGRQISHDLACVPGLIMVKSTNNSGDWMVYHRGIGATHRVKLNSTTSSSTTASWNDTTPTSTYVELGSNTGVNATGTSYVGYFFAGGEEGYNSVEFDGDDDYLSWAATSDFAFGTGAYTVEFWVYPNSLSNTTFFNVADTNGFACVIQSGKVTITRYGVGDQVATSTGPSIGQWTHYALVREGTGSNQAKIYKNGVLEQTGTDSTDWTVTATTGLGANAASGIKEWDGKISNFRIVKGTAVYTSAFTPPTTPLTNITNTKLLCCNGDLTTSSTVTPGTITANGNPNTTGTSPFTSPDAVFGENEDQNVIKCSSYVGDGNGGSSQGVANSQEIFLGWEPQWILIKRTSAVESWILYDSMRGIVTSNANADAKFEVNNSDAESLVNHIELTSTGFTFTTSNAQVNASGNDYIYMALRRPDGYCGKPRTATELFAMDTGAGGTTIPNFDSGFPVDFTLGKTVASSTDWFANARLIGTKELATNTNTAEGSAAYAVFDSNLGWGNASWQDSTVQSWQWRRGQGFDCIAYKGDGVAGRQIAHNLGPNNVPEMIWVKKRDGTTDWNVGHKGLNGGTNPWDYSVVLNSNESEADGINKWNDTSPTSTHFTIGDSGRVNTNTSNYIALLFASVDGISKVGYYDGSSSSQTITTGFQPRFVILKKANGTGHWYVLDTTRGWGSGNDMQIRLNKTDENVSYDFGAPTSTGFTLTTHDGYNANANKYIYYAHS